MILIARDRDRRKEGEREGIRGSGPAVSGAVNHLRAGRGGLVAPWGTREPTLLATLQNEPRNAIAGDHVGPHVRETSVRNRAGRE